MVVKGILIRGLTQIFSVNNCKQHNMNHLSEHHNGMATCTGANTSSTGGIAMENSNSTIMMSRDIHQVGTRSTPPQEITAEQALAIGKAHGLEPFDVICGKCSLAFNNVGNRRFRVVIGMNVQRYLAAQTRTAKSHVIQSVVKLFQDDIGANFVKQGADGKFVPVSDKVVRQKVGHALRDHAAFHLGNGTQIKSSSVSCPREATRSPNGHSSSVSSDSMSSSDLSKQSSQSAPVPVNHHSTSYFAPLYPTSASLDINQQPGGHHHLDETWADDLSMSSFDHPLEPKDVFPGTIEIPSEDHTIIASSRYSTPAYLRPNVLHHHDPPSSLLSSSSSPMNHDEAYANTAVLDHHHAYLEHGSTVLGLDHEEVMMDDQI